MSKPPRVYLSPPHMSGTELELVREAFESNWIAPLGPQVDAFESEFAEYLGVPYAAALSSGTAALHLSMHLTGVQAGDEILCPSLTFCATANAVLYVGATPVFIDSEKSSWNIDPDLVEEELRNSSKNGRLPRALISVDLYGQSANYSRLEEICAKYGVELIEDAAEALGATYGDRKVGSFGKLAAFSFNGNKIITTSGGGMLVSHEKELIDRARYLSTQAREPVVHYEHTTVGFNYRMSNILAAIGRGQLKVLDERVTSRRKNFDFYKKHLQDIPGIEFMPESHGTSTRWLTCILIDPKQYGNSHEQVRAELEKENIESRPIWKPLHLQPVYSQIRRRGGEVAEDIFEKGLCLPSGSSLTTQDQLRIVDVIRRLWSAGRAPAPL